MKKTIQEIEEIYDLELDKIVSEINTLYPKGHKKVTRKRKSKLVLLQFPDGLKLYATAIVDYLEENTNADFLIWFDTCFGACDTPVLGKQIEKQIDLVIQFGHNEMMPDY